MAKDKEWYGFDLDGTLATYEQGEWKGYMVIGNPIASMCEVAKQLHDDGKTVKIITARVSEASLSAKEATLEQIKEAIWKWCDANLGFRPDIVSEKDHHLNRFYDDRCLEVVRNEGTTVRDVYGSALHAIDTSIKLITSYMLNKDEAALHKALMKLREAAKDGDHYLKKFSE